MKFPLRKTAKKRAEPLCISPQIKRRSHKRSQKISQQLVEEHLIGQIKKTKKKVLPKKKYLGAEVINIESSQSTKKSTCSPSLNSKHSNAKGFGGEKENREYLEETDPCLDQVIPFSDSVRHESGYYSKFKKFIRNIGKIFTREYVTNVEFLLQIEKLEMKYSIPLDNHPKISSEFRRELIYWLHDLCLQYDYERKTFFSTVYLIDLYLSRTRLKDPQILQLIGIGAFSLMTKFHEINSNLLTVYNEKCKNRFSVNEIAEMEIEILKVVDYNLSFPTIYSILFLMMEKWDEFMFIAFENEWKFMKLVFTKGQYPNVKMYKTTIQTLDLFIICNKYLQYNPFKLCAGLMFCVLLKHSDHKRSKIFEYFLEDPFMTIKKTDEIGIFLVFLCENFKINYKAIRKSVFFLRTFLKFTLSNIELSSDDMKISTLLTPRFKKDKLEMFFKNED